MSTFHEKYQGNFIHIADFKEFFKRRRRLIISIGVLSALFTFALLLTTNPKYILKGSFKEALQKGDALSSSLAKSLFKGSSQVDLGAQAQSVMLSREHLLEIVRQLGLQGEIKPASIKTNVVSRWSKNMNLLLKKQINTTPALSFVKVVYLGSSEKVLHLEALDGGKVKVTSGSGHVLGVQPLSEMFVYEDSMFSLSSHKEIMAPGERYSLVLYPVENAIDTLLKRLSIKVRRDDASILDISYKDANPFRGARVLNTLMHNYKQYLVKENDRIAKAQLQYLNARQDYLSDKIEDTLKEHVKYLQENLGEKGFIGLHQELEMVESKKRRHHERLLEIDLNLGKLKRLRSEKLLCLNEPILGRDVESFQNALFGLKKQKDTMDLRSLLRIASVKESKKKKGGFSYLRTKRSHPSFIYYKEAEEQLDSQINEVERRDLLPIFSMMKQGLSDLYHARNLRDVRDPFHFGFEKKQRDISNIRRFKEQIRKMLSEHEVDFHTAVFNSSLDGRVDPEVKNVPLLNDSLARIDHLLALKESILMKSLFSEEDVSKEFSSIDLDTAKKLFIDYTKELDEIILKEKHLSYSLDSLGRKNFEMSSLTNILEDPISAEILNRAAKHSLELKNDKHFSEKDKTRLLAKLSRERKALGAHLKEMVHLADMQKDLIEEKLKALQSVMGDLINQEIAILEGQIDSAIDEKLQTLQIEKTQVSAKLKDLQGEMKDLPSKWLLENRLQLKADLNVSMMESLTQLVESKNVEHHLLQIESKPIDHAYIPLKPKQAPVMLLSAVGGIFGCLLTMGALAFRKTAANELPVSLDALAFRDFKVAGKLSKRFETADFASLSEKDLQALRKLSNFALSEDTQIVGAALGTKPSYLSALASLLALGKRKTILIELYHTSKASRAGLLHYLLGKKRELPIQKKGDFHLLSLGESTKYTMELLTRQKFETLISVLKEEYEVILIGLDKGACSAESHKLMQLSEKMLITLDEESLDDLYPYFEWEERMGESSCMYLAFE
ncbi:MAG: hypothetical protein S4CHLAM37_01910 [Chlamydiia bacterium]|nr:hypothetical protein [Chlamydiia bacterium]